MSLRQREEIQEVLRRRNRYLIGTVVVLFWAGMMALLIYREGVSGRFNTSSKSVPPKKGPTETWMGIFLPAENQVGFLALQETPENRNGTPGTSLLAYAEMKLMMLGTRAQLALSGSAWAAEDNSLADFALRAQSSGHLFRLSGSIREGQLEAKLQTGDAVVPIHFPLGEKFNLREAGMGPELNFADLEPGEERVMDSLDPVTFAPAKAKVKCLRRETLTVAGGPVETKMFEVSSGSMVVRTWLDAEDQVARLETPFGFTLQRIRPEEACTQRFGQDSEDLLNMAAVRPTGQPVFRGARRMVAKLTTTSDATVPTDSTQRELERGVIAISPPDISTDTGATPPEPLPDLEELAPDPFVQSDQAEIANTAYEIVGDEADPWKKSERLYEWVYENIRKEPVLSFPSALDVLKTRVGDCNEHTVLFVALARAADIPSRIAIGVVWSDQYAGFYYHAW
ncbi:MAG: transglutaminase domain-containing protein, partial [Candidatus Hydrogenedentes bacterium]|nr:transglutaminase domain-containing protein [Candidatus Hydrogenedentota bacterium]